MAPTTKPKVLCVDDEPNVVAGIARQLSSEFQVTTATSGVRALSLLETDGPFIILMSDMRMPIMDGAALLNHAALALAQSRQSRLQQFQSQNPVLFLR